MRRFIIECNHENAHISEDWTLLMPLKVPGGNIYWIDTGLNLLLDEKVPEWVSCSKLLPKIPVRVQVQMDNGWIITAYYDDGYWYSVPGPRDAIDPKHVLAWRELPSEYQEKEEINEQIPYTGGSQRNSKDDN